jgi:hypothetical protein
MKKMTNKGAALFELGRIYMPVYNFRLTKLNLTKHDIYLCEFPVNYICIR